MKNNQVIDWIDVTFLSNQLLVKCQSFSFTSTSLLLLDDIKVKSMSEQKYDSGAQKQKILKCFKVC